MEKKCRKYCQNNKIVWVYENMVRKSSESVELPKKRLRQGKGVLNDEKSDKENEKESFKKIKLKKSAEKKEDVSKIDSFIKKIDRNTRSGRANNEKKVQIKVMKLQTDDRNYNEKNNDDKILTFKSKNTQSKINIEHSSHKGQKETKLKVIKKGKISLKTHPDMKTKEKSQEEEIKVLETDTKNMVKKGKINLKVRNDSNYKTNKIKGKTIKIQNIFRYNDRKEGFRLTELRSKRANKEIMIEKKVIEIDSDNEAKMVDKRQFEHKIEENNIGEVIEIESDKGETDTHMQGYSLDNDDELAKLETFEVQDINEDQGLKKSSKHLTNTRVITYSKQVELKKAIMFASEEKIKNIIRIMKAREPGSCEIINGNLCIYLEKLQVETFEELWNSVFN